MVKEDLILELRQCSEALMKIADALQVPVLQASASEEAPAVAEEKQLTKEDVRAVAAEKARMGYTKEIRELMVKHGADRLSDMDPKEYTTFLAELEVLGDAR